MSRCIYAFLLLATAFAAPAALGGEIVSGPVHVCRKPMLQGNAAFANTVNPGPDAWLALAERQAEEAKNCYQAGEIEILSKGVDIDVGLNTQCAEYKARAGDEEVYVAIGARNRVWGRCP